MGFQQGLSGLNGAARSLDVIGNNIANASTVGFKSSLTQFADVYATSLYGAGGLQVGIGSKVADVAQQFGQGNISASDNALDLAISGEGFFLVNQGGATAYSRNGQFHLDKPDTGGMSHIINSQGLQVMGYGVDAFGNIVTASPGPLQVSFADIAPRATTVANLVANLDSTKSAPGVAFATNNAASYNDATSVTVYDSLGNAHALTLYFVKTGANAWNMYGDIDGSGIGNVDLGAGAGNPVALSFNASGLLTTGMPLSGVAAAVTSGASTPMTFALDLSGATQYGSKFGVNSVSQDGYASGRLAGLSVAKDGTIQGRYTNSQSKTLGQVALAYFANTQGLQPIGNNLWMDSAEAGQAVIGAPGSGVLGVIESGAVEESNVDLTAELVNLIVAQRMYQANAQTIRAQDQILQTLVNLR
ncbi:MAG TPA: flagellar hook protein FlgE [Thiobacillaceae bacterium]|nr:flagellar hook protein FlgE [Thiobacillaceae bacterium]HNU62974.1 flagellar hook protein FlgE [Thiobacillaceae bacterium]